MASIQVYKSDTFEIQRQKINQLSEKVDRATKNVVFVSKDGNDSNTGANLANAKLTIKAALEIATAGTVIRVAAGTYIEDNPLFVPAQVSIVGSSLREVTVTPLNMGDLFYVNNGCYVSDMSFVGSVNPGSIFSFDPLEVPYIDQSPYIQNCTNFIPDSIGMKIDGNNAIGPIKSMVVDSYTQYNANGIGALISNEAYAQLVSMFTICTDKAIVCTSGGSCDLTNPNSSFGNYGLVADGVSPLKYTAKVSQETIADAFVVKLNLSSPPLFISNVLYDETTGNTTITTSTNHNFQVGMDIKVKNAEFVCPYSGRWIDASNLILSNKELIANEAVERMLFDNLGFNIPGGNQECIDDALKIIDALAFNVKYGGNNRVYDAANVYINQPNLLDGEKQQSIEVYNHVRDLAIQAMRNEIITKINGVNGHNIDQVFDSNVQVDPNSPTCADVASAITTLIEIITYSITFGNLSGITRTSGENSAVQYFPSGAFGHEFQVTATPSPTVFEAYVGISNIEHAYEMGGTVTLRDIYDVTLKNNIPYELTTSSIAYFYKQSRLLASSHAFQYIGSGTEINNALPQNEGTTISENETVSINGGLVVYTSTDQSGNFKIGDGVIIDQSTGTISGEAYGRSLFATVTPFILALGA